MDWKSMLFAMCCVSLTQPLYAKTKGDEIRLKPIEVIGKRKKHNPEKHHVRGKDLNPVQGVADIENHVPGIDVRKSGGPGQRTVVSMQGLPAQGTQVNLEGVPVNFPYFGGADVSQMALPVLGGVDVTSGGMAVMHGQGYGRVDVSLPRMRPGQFRLDVTGGSLGFGMLDAQSAFRTGGVTIQPMAVFRYCDGAFTFVDTNGNERERRHNASAAGEGALRVATRAHHNKWVTVVDGFADRRDVAGPEQFPSNTALQHDRRFLIVQHIKGRVAGRFRHDTSIYVRYSGFTYQDSKPPMGPKMDTHLETLSLAGHTTHSIRIKGLRPFIGTGFGFIQGWTKRAYKQVRDTPRRVNVSGTAGLGYLHRYVHVKAGLHVDWTQGIGVTMLPAGMLVLKPLRQLHFYGTAGRFFRVPSFDELYFNAYFVRGNPDLKPESGWRFTGGVVVKVPHIRVQAGYFHVLASGLILFLPRSAYSIQAQNTKGARSRGVEALLRVHVPYVRLVSGYTWTSAVFKSSGKSLPYVPRHVVFATLKAASRYIRGYLGFRWQSGFFMDDYENLHEEARWDLYAGASLRIGNFVRISVYGNNLLGKRDSVDSFQNPLPGREVFFSLTVTSGGVK